MRKMTETIRKKIALFRATPGLRVKFSRAAKQAEPCDILWPEKRPAAFPKEFHVTIDRVATVYPLLDAAFKLDCIEMRVEGARRSEAPPLNPLSAYYDLSLFQQTLAAPHNVKPKSDTKKKKGSAKKGKAAVSDRPPTPWERIEKLKDSLDVPPAVRKAEHPEDIARAVITLASKTGMEHSGLKHVVSKLEAEIQSLRRPDYLPAAQKEIFAALTKRNQELQRLHDKAAAENAKEKIRNDFLETEVNRLAERLITSPPRDPIAQELETIRQEYSILSQKYDLLVTHNIALSNRLQQINTAKTLEDILDLVRDKINSVIRAGVQERNDVLLRTLRGEISQLVRARTYLGRALYDLGRLYLRTGEEHRAIVELRAARELGVEDPETNRIINSN
ncbi:MAG: hypothetical protein HY042_00130 [Spirochaetia bacterium]|nr:hypothetical protein [Spirochaetia bacterium]